MAGLRVAVKDNFDLEHANTSLCSLPYHKLYPPVMKTAACIEQLEEAGAVVVGKAKLCSFASWEEPLETIDYPAPMNPRADGLLSPGGSSSGSGAAIAAYDWLDIAVGSDSMYILLNLSMVNAHAGISYSYW